MSRRLKSAAVMVSKRIEHKRKDSRLNGVICAANKAPTKNKKEGDKLVVYMKSRARRGAGKYRPQECQELDFSAFPITGTHVTVGVEKMIRDRALHQLSHENKIANGRMIEVSALPPLPYVEKAEEEGGEVVKLFKSVDAYRAEIKEWRLAHMGNMAKVDKAKAVSLNEPKKGTLTIVKPTGNACKAKPPKAEYQNADGYTKAPDMAGQGAVIAEPKYKAAGSFKREIPLPLCMWMIAMQEDWTPEQRKQAKIIKDEKAQELLDWMHANAY